MARKTAVSYTKDVIVMAKIRGGLTFQKAHIPVPGVTVSVLKPMAGARRAAAAFPANNRKKAMTTTRLSRYIARRRRKKRKEMQQIATAKNTSVITFKTWQFGMGVAARI
ncbi:hypothetical protein VKT23_015523 [Stygiomarasmius scandens]|uniref:Uncharacterized protein n=1 Tax=Marasmiellus scandens TaxID=2682957 RepID=A0ABR1J0G0_9AGAR